ncbi:MAG TPA: type 1 glutamine amidotransferase [Candidatus Stackebrandtia faecavium]|nr:type 1 glutamine amidotransferase [Candidatus Stackebrandtia faecavium]
MTGELSQRTIAFLSAPEGTEQIELTQPWDAVVEAGGTPKLISTKTGEIQAFHHLDRADRFPIDAMAGDVSAEDFQGLVLPGGVANPDFLRTDPLAVRFVLDIVAAGIPIAAICHAPWLLIEAGVVNGRTLTSYPSLKTDLRNAGAHWVDDEVVIDDGLVTSRKPGDLPAFCAAFIKEFQQYD